MATKSIEKINYIFANIETWKWSSLQLNDDGAALELPGLADKTVQVYGTFGGGGKVILEGACDPTIITWVPIHDPQGNALEFISAGIEQILENPLKIRPRVTAGDGTTSLTVVIICRK
jgi:hypothetical protein